MTPVFDKQDGEEGKTDRGQTEVTDDATQYCKW